MINTKELFQKLGFKIEHVIKDEKYRDNYVFAGKIGFKRFLLKVTSANNEKIALAMEREQFADRVISHSPVRMKSTRVVDFGKEKDSSWLLREYLPGKSLSFDMSAYENIDQKFIEHGGIILPQIIEILQSFSRINLSDKKILLGLKSKRLKTEIEMLLSPELEENLGFCPTEQVEFYNSFKKVYLSAKNSRIIMGDFNPGNIIVNEKNYAVYISDLSWICKDNYLTDVVYLWFFFWKLPIWQKTLTDNFVKTIDDQNNFRASLIRQCLQFGWENTRAIKKKIGQKRHNLWRKYLLAAGESFDAIMKVK